MPVDFFLFSKLNECSELHITTGYQNVRFRVCNGTLRKIFFSGTFHSWVRCL